MWVKICANTSLEDAIKAVEFGADALGFVFAASKRQVTAAQVQAITRELPQSVETVGVFAGADADAIARAVEEAGLKSVQLHGGLDLALAATLVDRLGPEIQIIHTAHWSVDPGADASAPVAAALSSLNAFAGSPRLLVDAKLSGSSGGLGLSFDWSAARSVLASAPETRVRVIVAGGLRPDNVAEAVHTLRPWGVDVASGVEREPGHKDYTLLKAFIENARAA